MRRFIHVSSLSAREPALSDYGWSKAKSERLVAASGLDWTIIRPPAVYGPGDRETFELFKMARRGIVALPPRGRFSVIHVEDLCRLILAREHHFGERPLQYPLPEPATLLRLQETVLYPVAELPGVSSQAAVSHRYHGFQARSQQPCQNR